MRTRNWAALLATVLAVTGCTATAQPRADPATASRQSAAEVDQTLASLRRVDDLPLYAMTYVGDYDELAGVVQAAAGSPYGCSLFVASGDKERPLFGRNFDWEPNAALVLHTDPPDGYASVSIVDIKYVGVDAAEDVLASPASRRKLLDAPLRPFDGMNEKGLAVGLAADEAGSLRPDPAKPTVSGVRIIRLMLDQAATVDEAVAVLRRYNIDFGDGPPLHYLLADATGASAVVEFVDGATQVLPGGPPWQALTNIRLAGADEGTRQADRRYATASAALGRAGGVLDWRAAMGILQAVAQPHTRWSVTYELRTGQVRVVTGKRWGTVHELHLPMRLDT